MSEHNPAESGEFYTLKGYSSMNGSEIPTSAMEDYLEMIYRLYCDNQIIRIKRISEILHVKPSSASKMAGILKNSGYVDFKKYGQITLTEKGLSTGAYLLYRHNILHRFFCFINHSNDELSLVERIEHFVDKETVANIERLLNDMGTP